MKKSLLVIASAMTTLILAGCTMDPNVKGTVTDKDIERPKGKPICYELEITDTSGNHQDYCVRRGTYDQYEVGDTYP